MMHEVLAVLIGKATPFRGADEPSAIAKLPREGPVVVGPLGLAGDEQADRENHGGHDKAMLHYAADHYPFWREMLGDHPLLERAGAFGENISALGLTETGVCIGDRFRLGTALVEVSHGRKPCWKLAHRFAVPAMVAQVVGTRRAGWYYRVIEPGQVAAGDAMSLLDRPQPEWTVARVFGLLVGGDHKREPEALRTLAALDVLAEAWRKIARERLAASR